MSQEWAPAHAILQPKHLSTILVSILLNAQLLSTPQTSMSAFPVLSIVLRVPRFMANVHLVRTTWWFNRQTHAAVLTVPSPSTVLNVSVVMRGLRTAILATLQANALPVKRVMSSLAILAFAILRVVSI
jgi:hypothetical protein